jgi:pimeloyl-ACP methyl ester carboxylesterase
MKKYSHIFGVFSILAILALGTFIYLKVFKSSVNVRNATLPEQIVFAKSNDDILNAGVVFNAKKEIAKPIAVIWVHGWGVNFYSPTYVSIGRGIAARGYTCFAVNTRMHDLGNVEGYKGDKRLRGGGVWGVGSDQTKDIAAWVDFVESNGFKKVILVGHSAGCAAVRVYQAEKQDKRVIGLVLASSGVNPDDPIDSSLVSQASRLTSENKGDALVEDPKRSFPSYTSAATIVDIVNTPPAYKDFFGVHIINAGVAKIKCPILAFYGSNGDIANENELELLKASIKKQPKGPGSVTTTMIKGADHMYGGEEEQVATVITKWIADISKQK